MTEPKTLTPEEAIRAIVEDDPRYVVERSGGGGDWMRTTIAALAVLYNPPAKYDWRLRRRPFEPTLGEGYRIELEPNGWRLLRDVEDVDVDSRCISTHEVTVANSGGSFQSHEPHISEDLTQYLSVRTQWQEHNE